MKKSLSFTQRPIFWISQILVSIVCAFLAFKYYPVAFPMIDLPIQMDRTEALQESFQLFCKYHWGPANPKQTATFKSDDKTQTFIELSQGGHDAFTKIIQKGIYAPYTWNVRNFIEGSPHETLVRFTPDGHFYGFVEKLPEDLPGTSVSSEEAQKIAETSAQDYADVHFSDYKLIERSNEVHPNHRVDHTFIYERIHENLGEGKYRLRMSVSGDRFTELTHFVKVPDSFSRRYSEMRSANNTIAAAATTAMALFYLLFGCGFGIFFLAKRHWLLWKEPIVAGLIVSGCQLLEQLNNFPLSWMHYDTAVSSQVFILQKTSSAVILFILDFLLVTVSFMAAEGLSRKAFGHHPQFWKIWKPQTASSNAILGRTVGGFLSTSFFFAFVVGIYLFGSRVLGWWSPSDTLFQPDALSTYCPWFTSIANSLHAGFWEESLFRAVPLAGAALLGEKWGGRKKWIFAAFILQAAIFGAAHANYPAQPSYARLIELIIPSFIFGSIYLLFGLLPGIILHFTFDVVSFAIPIFAAHTSRIWIDKTLVVLITLIPLWIVLFSRIREGKWHELKAKDLNEGWHPTKKTVSKDNPIQPKKALILSPTFLFILSILATASILVQGFGLKTQNINPSLDIGKQEAIALAKKTLQADGVRLDDSWEALATTEPGSPEEQQLIWKTEKADVYRGLLGNYLEAPHWEIRFVRFHVNVEERAEEYRVLIGKNGEIFRVRHTLPESRKGQTLAQEDARKLAYLEIQKKYQLTPDQLKEVSSTPTQMPSRKDWLFIFSNPSIHLAKGEARIAVRILGNQIGSSGKFIFIPEDWQRQQRNLRNQFGIIKTVSFLILAILLLGGVIAAGINWTKKKSDSSIFWKSFAVFLLGHLLQVANQFPNLLANLSTTEPKTHQIATRLAFGILSGIIFSACFSLMSSYFQQKAHSKAPLPSAGTFTGYAAGVAGTVVFMIVSYFIPINSPRIGRIENLDLYLSKLSFLNQFEIYFLMIFSAAMIVILIEYLTWNGTRRKFLEYLGFLFFSFALSGVYAEDFSHWAAWGFAGWIILEVLYHFLISFSLSIIPLIVGAALISAEWNQAMMKPYLDAKGDATIAMIFFLVLSFCYFWKSEPAKRILSSA